MKALGLTASSTSPLLPGLRPGFFAKLSASLCAGLLLGMASSAHAVAGPGAGQRLTASTSYCEGRLAGGLVGATSMGDRETQVQLIITLTLTNTTGSTLNYQLMLPGNESNTTPLGTSTTGSISANQTVGPLGLVKIGGMRQFSDAAPNFNRYKQMLRVRCN